MSSCSIVSKKSPSEQVGERAMSGVHVGKPARFLRVLCDSCTFIQFALTILLYRHGEYCGCTALSYRCVEIKESIFVFLYTSPKTKLLPCGFVAKSDPGWGAERVSCIHGAVLGCLVAADLQLIIVWFIFHAKVVVSGYSVDVVLVPHVHLQLVVLRVCEP